jgi:hypothetical protein
VPTLSFDYHRVHSSSTQERAYNLQTSEATDDHHQEIPTLADLMDNILKELCSSNPTPEAHLKASIQAAKQRGELIQENNLRTAGHQIVNNELHDLWRSEQTMQLKQDCQLVLLWKNEQLHL